MLRLYADAPWIELDDVVDTDIILKFVEGDDWISGNIPLEVTENAVWWRK